jgi:hypothetical protein
MVVGVTFLQIAPYREQDFFPIRINYITWMVWPMKIPPVANKNNSNWNQISDHYNLLVLKQNKTAKWGLFTLLWPSQFW